jgi:anthranilate 1,2-dioxygenase small subunit
MATLANHREGIVTVTAEEKRELEMRLRHFYEQYTSCLDECDYERWSSFFVDDAQYRIISREDFSRGLPIGAMSCDGIGMIRDRVRALVEVLVFEPRIWRRYISSVRISSVTGNVIESKANFLLFESKMDREPQLNMLGQYVDTLVKENGTYRIKSRDCVYDNYRIQTTLFAPV